MATPLPSSVSPRPPMSERPRPPTIQRRETIECGKGKTQVGIRIRIGSSFDRICAASITLVNLQMKWRTDIKNYLLSRNSSSCVGARAKRASQQVVIEKTAQTVAAGGSIKASEQAVRPHIQRRRRQPYILPFCRPQGTLFSLLCAGSRLPSA